MLTAPPRFRHHLNVREIPQGFGMTFSGFGKILLCSKYVSHNPALENFHSRSSLSWALEEINRKYL